MTEVAGDQRWRRELRLIRRSEFRRVYDGQVRARSGPLLVWGRPNELGFSRMGLAIGRRAGSAVTRNRIKRMLREAFRTIRAELPAGYDLVVGASRHERITLDEYREHLCTATRRLERTWTRKRDKSDSPPAG